MQERAYSYNVQDDACITMWVEASECLELGLVSIPAIPFSWELLPGKTPMLVLSTDFGPFGYLPWELRSRRPSGYIGSLKSKPCRHDQVHKGVTETCVPSIESVN